MSLSRRFRWALRALVLLVGSSLLCVVPLRWLAPPTTAFMLEKRIGRWIRGETGPPLRYRWVDWREIAPAMRLSAVAAEDQKFPHHWGFDFASISEAVERSGSRGRLRGASTITQQVARNLFLWPGRSYVRKGLEAYVALLLEFCWPKRRILEVYLNVAEFGDGVYGVEAAAALYFGKRAKGLQPGEAALLAAVLPNPVRFHAAAPSAHVRARAAWIGEQMERLGGAGYLRGL